ncbi:Helitron helicase-like protein [Phytophthora palmivora]|uniref:ATP-dependent DNA helicase n=1 Tax=Phytophthora palmivora TaxID=4796 RepID=A0A2P4XBW0_9STRA|nr:Helitron helicase-like protein [Phytophthora palmivora]
MMHRACFEAVDRSFRGIMKNELEPFGGKVMVFSGDHRQILPVLKDATRAETLEACFKSSPLWSHLRQVRPTENKRVQTAPDPASAAELAEFSDFLLQIGEGRYPVKLVRTTYGFHATCARADDRWDDKETKENENMEAPPNFNLLPPTEHLLIEVRKQNVNALIDAVYPGGGDDNLPDEYFVERAILAPTNVADPNMFEPEFLISLNFSGIPPHRIVLKVFFAGTPIIMIRNLNSDAGLCNGTRLRVVSLRKH